MSQAAVVNFAGEILEELSLLGRDHPKESNELIEAFRRIWAVPPGPEKVRIIRSAQALVERLWSQQQKVNRSRDLLSRYERAYKELEAIFLELSQIDQSLTLEAREQHDLKAMTLHPTSAIEEVWDNEADSVYDDL